MDKDEIKDRLKSVVNNLIKDDPEGATRDLHDVLAAKMRARISGHDEGEVGVDDLEHDDLINDELAKD